MNKKIENDFFSNWNLGNNLLIEIKNNYNLHLRNSKIQNVSKVEQFGDVLVDFFEQNVMTANNPLFAEIENNLQECKTTEEKERYVHSLIIPFKEWSDVFYPDVSEYTNETDVQRVIFIANEIRRILNTPPQEYDIKSTETLFGYYFGVFCVFYAELDAILLRHNIDLLKLQNECGVYLTDRRKMSTLSPFVGTYKLTKHYINKLHTNTPTPEPQQTAPTESKEPKQRTFADLLMCSNKQAVIEKMRGRLTKPREVATILFALSDLHYLDIGNKAEIYRALFAEFGYHSGFEALERGVNYALITRKGKDIDTYVELFNEVVE